MSISAFRPRWAEYFLTQAKMMFSSLGLVVGVEITDISVKKWFPG